MPKRGKTGWKDGDGCYLVVEEGTFDERGSFVIMWYLPEDADLGGNIGDSDEKEPMQAELCRLAREAGGRQRRKGAPFTWDTAAAASKALRSINAGMLAWESGKPWPEWAKQAAASGWTPPKGWTP